MDAETKKYIMKQHAIMDALVALRAKNSDNYYSALSRLSEDELGDVVTNVIDKYAIQAKHLDYEYFTMNEDRNDVLPQGKTLHPAARILNYIKKDGITGIDVADATVIIGLTWQNNPHLHPYIEDIGPKRHAAAVAVIELAQAEITARG